jgi:dihydroorotate dehydrogenase (NAD+) catalytic subunit
MADLRVDLGFLRLRNPVLTASGTYGYGTEFRPYMDLSAIGGIVVKGLYYGPREGNPPPRLVETASGLINAIGLQGVGVEHFAADVLPELRKYDTAVIVNVCGASNDEYLRVIEFLDRQAGIAAYELNISCPNVKQNGACPAMNPRATRAIVAEAKRRSRRPVIAKLSPNVTNIAEIARAVDLETRRPKLGTVFGGLSGPAIKPIALRMTYQVAQAVKIPILGLGGIMTGRDALEFMMVGARAVQVGTANFIDPAASARIAGEMGEFCDAHGLARVAEIVGTLKIVR